MFEKYLPGELMFSEVADLQLFTAIFSDFHFQNFANNLTILKGWQNRSNIGRKAFYFL